MIGKPVTVLIAEHQLDLMPEVVQALAAGRTVHREGVALRRDGSHLEAELNASPIMGADGWVRGTALIVLDISERRRTQRLLDRIVEHAPTSIAVKDLEGRYLLYGERGAEAIGRRSEDIIGRTDHEVFAPSVAARLVAQDQRVLASGEPMTSEETLRGPDGQVYVFITTRFPLPGPERQDRGDRPDRRRRLGDPARRDRPRAAGRARAGRPGRDRRARPRRADHDLEPGRRGDVRPSPPSRRSAAATTS